MKFILRRIGARLASALLVVFATCGVAAASASANLPEYIGSQPYSFSLKGGEVTLATEKGIPVTCKSVSGSVTLKFWNKFSAGVVFKECSAPLSGKCSSAGAAAGEIRANTATLFLVYLSRSAHEAALLFNWQESGKAETFATFNCEKHVSEVVVRGNFLAKVTPVNSLTKVFTLSLKGSNGKPELTKYEYQVQGGYEKGTAALEESANKAAFAPADLNAVSLEIPMEVSGEIAA
jgi:hypothetical protein